MNKAALDDTQAQLMFLREMKERDVFDHEVNYYRDLACEHQRHATSLEAKIQELESMLDMNHQNACSNEGLLGQYARSLKEI